MIPPTECPRCGLKTIREIKSYSFYDCPCNEVITFYGNEFSINCITIIIKPYAIDMYLNDGCSEVTLITDIILMIDFCPVQLIHKTDEEILKWIKDMLIFS